MRSIFDQNLPRTNANYMALSPLSYIERTAEVDPQRPAIVHGDVKYPNATEEAFAGAWFNSGDMAVLYRHPDVLSAAGLALLDACWAKRTVLLADWRQAPAIPSRTSWRTAKNTWPASRCRAQWCSASCRTLRPAGSTTSIHASRPLQQRQ